MAKQLTPAQIAAYIQSLGLTAAPPTEAVGAKGSKPFVGNKNATTSRQVNKDAYTAGLNNRVPVQNMNDLSNPKWWAKNIAAGGKSAVVDPLWEASKMKWLDPESGLNPLERLNTLLGDTLTVGSMVAPVKGAATALTDRAIANAWARSVPNMTKPAGPTAADYFFGKYGVHGSPNQNIPELEPRLGSHAFPDDRVTFAMDFTDPSINYDMREAVNRAMRLYGSNDGSVYVAKYPRGYETKQYNNFIVSDAPGKVVGEVKLGDLGGRMGNVYEDLVTDSAYQLRNQLLANIKSPSLRKKFIENMMKRERDEIAQQAADKAEMAARSALTERRWSGMGTGSGVS